MPLLPAQTGRTGRRGSTGGGVLNFQPQIFEHDVKSIHFKERHMRSASTRVRTKPARPESMKIETMPRSGTCPDLTLDTNEPNKLHRSQSAKSAFKRLRNSFRKTLKDTKEEDSETIEKVESPQVGVKEENRRKLNIPSVIITESED